MIQTADTAPSYDAAQLIARPMFWEALKGEASDLLKVHAVAPEVVHYLADIRHWILIHMAIALHFERKIDPAAPPLTPKKLLTELAGPGIASRNTVQSFLRELLRIKLTEPPKTGTLRQHATEVSAKSEKLMFVYIDIHLRALDMVDGGGRSALFNRTPTLLHKLQPAFARKICLNPAWYNPPAMVNCFTNSVSGSSILHEMVLSTQSNEPDGYGRFWLGTVSTAGLAARYHVSDAHISRILIKAQQVGGIGWENERRRGACWLSTTLRDAYLLWQAEKLAALSSAFNRCVSATA